MNRIQSIAGRTALVLSLGIAGAVPAMAQSTAGSGTTGGTAGTTSGGSTMTTRNDTDHKDYSWIGLLGLVGLAGLFRKRDSHVDMHRTNTTAAR